MKSGQGKRLLIAALAMMGMIGGTAIPTRANEQSPVAIRNGMDTRRIEADHFGDYMEGMLGALWRNTGNPPDIWGRSRAYARMVRKSRMHRMGIGHARI